VEIIAYDNLAGTIPCVRQTAIFSWRVVTRQWLLRHVRTTYQFAYQFQLTPESTPYVNDGSYEDGVLHAVFAPGLSLLICIFLFIYLFIYLFIIEIVHKVHTHRKKMKKIE